MNPRTNRSVVSSSNAAHDCAKASSASRSLIWKGNHIVISGWLTGLCCTSSQRANWIVSDNSISWYIHSRESTPSCFSRLWSILQWLDRLSQHTSLLTAPFERSPIALIQQSSSPALSRTNIVFCALRKIFGICCVAAIRASLSLWLIQRISIQKNWFPTIFGNWWIRNIAFSFDIRTSPAIPGISCHSASPQMCDIVR